MWYNGNVAIDSIGVNFLPEQYNFDQTDIGSFIKNVKEQNRLPFDKLTIFYTEDYWNFEGYTKTNLSLSSFRFNFGKVDVCFRDELKNYVLISIIEGRKKINIINYQFRQIAAFFNYCASRGAVAISDIQEKDAAIWISKTKDCTERYKHAKGQSIRSFFEYYNANYRNIFTKEYFDEIALTIDENLLKAEIQNNKTSNIPDDYFDKAVSAAIQTIDDKNAPSFYRALSCMFLMDSQIGLRTGELFALKVGCINPITISTGDTAYFIEYDTWKRNHGTGTISKEITYVNDIFKKGYDAILKISEQKRIKIKSDYLFVERKGNKKTKYPITPAEASVFMVDLFEYFNKYFTTVYNEPQNVNGLSCSLRRTNSTKKHSVQYVIHPTFTQIRVHMCSELYAKGCPIEYIEKFMSHLSSEMAYYYVRPKNSIQENLDASLRVLKEMITKEAVPIGVDKGLVAKIDEFISKNKFSIETDLDTICEKLAKEIPIRIKTGGVCIKSSRFRECSKDARTDEFYCAYGVCPNIYTFYYMADISYRQIKELSEAIELNRQKGCIKQVQKNTNMMQTILNNKLIPQIRELKRTISEKGLDFVLKNHPHIEMVVYKLNDIEKEIEAWKQLSA